MLYIPAYLVSLIAWSSLLGQQSFGDIKDIIAIATIAAGVLIVARYRGALEASESAGKAWKEERDAELAHAARLEGDIIKLTAEKVALQARTDLTAFQKEQARRHDEMMGKMDALLHAIEAQTQTATP